MASFPNRPFASLMAMLVTLAVLPGALSRALFAGGRAESLAFAGHVNLARGFLGHPGHNGAGRFVEQGTGAGVPTPIAAGGRGHIRSGAGALSMSKKDMRYKLATRGKNEDELLLTVAEQFRRREGQASISWYPGHIAKAEKNLQEVILVPSCAAASFLLAVAILSEAMRHRKMHVKCLSTFEGNLPTDLLSRRAGA